VDLVSLTAAVVTALSTAILGVLAFRFSRHAGQYGAQRAIGDLHTALARYRAEYPDVMRRCRTWDKNDLAAVYGIDPARDIEPLVRYAAYVDLGLEFCSTALAAAKTGLISPKVFEGHYRPLVRLFLVENYRFLETVLDGPYVSTFVRDEITAAARSGWDWQARYDLLGALPDPAPTAS
jgi:hypothetical protein